MAKVDIGTETYDAYAGLDEATVYLGADITRAVVWASKTPDAQGRGLVSATRMMAGLPWIGAAPDFNAVPEALMEATAELAADLLAKPALFKNPTGASNVKVAKAGSAQVEFFAPVDAVASPIPIDIWKKLYAAGLIGSQDPEPTGLDGPYVSGICGDARPLDGRGTFEWDVSEQDYS